MLNCDYSWITTKPIAHRGLWDKDAPENSLLAYKNAISHGYAIEIDLYITTDKQIVCFHDKSLKRLTGVDRNVFDLPFDELNKLYINGSNQKIPKLKEVLELCENKAPLLIELKEQPDKDYVFKAVELLKEYKGEFAIQSFNPFYIQKVKKLAPNFVCGVLGSNNPDTNGFLRRWVVKKMPFNFLCKPLFISYEYTGLPLKIIKRKNLPVLAWTVKNQNTYEKIKPYTNNIIFENFIPK